jgi:DNA mismatch repair protein MutL
VPIRVLDPVVADAIAAGEVVERPASVLKELLENAVDAGARRVSIEVEGGGATRLMVLDDGSGIPPQELALAFRRHATSKVSTLSDLDAVASLGFRGEALASIAAVSRVACSSAVAGAAAGARIEVVYGEVGEVRPAPPVAGTRVEVSGLFENTPARKAFLKRPATETGAILRVATATGLAHPGLALQVTVDGRRGLRMPGGGLGEALAAAFPGAARAEWLPVAGAREGFSVEGRLAPPELLKRTREHLHLSVNGRPVSSRSLAFAIEQAYRGLAEPGFFPVGALAITVPAAEVDVNVHPTKREVRFRHERLLFSVVQRACLEALGGSGAYGGSRLWGSGWGSAAAGSEDEAGQGSLGFGAGQGGTGVALYPPIGGGGLQLLGEAAAGHGWAGETVEARHPDLAEVPEVAAGRPLRRGPFRLVGQAMSSYIVAEGPAGLVLVDQHAAHERVLTNALLARRYQAGADLQPLLVPVVIHLTPAQQACLADHLGDLSAAGLEVEDFGPGAARVTAHAPVLPARRLGGLALEVIDALAGEGGDDDVQRRLERITYTIACHAAVKFGQRLSPAEMEALLRELEVADPGITCPHGRPTMLEIGERDLRREFRRP